MELINPQKISRSTEQSYRNRLAQLCNGLLVSNTFDCVDTIIYNSSAGHYHKQPAQGSNQLKTDRYLYYLHSGLAHTYITDPVSKKIKITKIWTKGDMIVNMNTLIKGSVAEESTHMLEDGELVYISYESLRILSMQIPQMMNLFLHLQLEQQSSYHYYIDLLHLPGPKRLQAFLRKHPTLLQRINQDIIANYLRMSRSRLSKALKLNKTIHHGN
jgi:CRP-like cAMP-binding protein